jgi:hypothetical protein
MVHPLGSAPRCAAHRAAGLLLSYGCSIFDRVTLLRNRCQKVHQVNLTSVWVCPVIWWSQRVPPPRLLNAIQLSSYWTMAPINRQRTESQYAVIAGRAYDLPMRSSHEYSTTLPLLYKNRRVSFQTGSHPECRWRGGTLLLENSWTPKTKKPGKFSPASRNPLSATRGGL